MSEAHWLTRFKDLAHEADCRVIPRVFYGVTREPLQFVEAGAAPINSGFSGAGIDWWRHWVCGVQQQQKLGATPWLNAIRNRTPVSEFYKVQFLSDRLDHLITRISLVSQIDPNTDKNNESGPLAYSDLSELDSIKTELVSVISELDILLDSPDVLLGVREDELDLVADIKVYRQEFYQAANDLFYATETGKPAPTIIGLVHKLDEA